MIALLLVLSATTPAGHGTVSIAFGSGPGNLGVMREAEASPEAPGSLAVDAEGNSFILDAVHSRVAVFNKQGALDATIPLGSDTVEDFALLPSGDIAVIDRLVDRAVTILAPNGAVLARAGVEGAGIDDGGEVTAIFADASGVWLEVLHAGQVRVLDGDNRVDNARATRAGLPVTRRGGTEYVRLRKVGDGAQVLFFDASGALVGDNALRFSSLLELSGLVVQGDTIWVAGHELVQRTPMSRPTRDVIVVAELAVQASGELVEKNRHEVKASPEFVPLKQLVAAGSGKVAHLFVDSSARPGSIGAEVTSW